MESAAGLKHKRLRLRYVCVHACMCAGVGTCCSPVTLFVSLAPGQALAFVCNVCNVSVCICVHGLSGRRQRGTARGGQTQQVKEKVV